MGSVVLATALAVGHPAGGQLQSSSGALFFPCGTIMVDTKILAGDYLLSCQVYVQAPATLTLEPGVNTYAMETLDATRAPAIVVQRGAKIHAAGTPEAPITLTSLDENTVSTLGLASDSNINASIPKGKRGKWGGLILLGNAPTSKAGGESMVEGIVGRPYGGTDPYDSSGVLQYVRVWYGGAIVGADNEINGITFGGVGAGTVVDHCEVAFNADDGFEFFGGTVNVKFLSALFVGDDAFDTDEGYQGKGQYLFAMTGLGGDKGTEMDSKTDSDFGSMPRSHPQLTSMTIIGGGPNQTKGGDIMRLREATGGKFANLVLMHGKSRGIKITDCGPVDSSPSITQTLPAPEVSLGAPGASNAQAGYLFVSPSIVIDPATTPGTIDVSSDCQPKCTSAGPPCLTVHSITPDLSGVLAAHELEFDLLPVTFDPLPTPGGNLCGGGLADNAIAAQDPFFDTVECVGAFASPDSNWLKGWSLLDRQWGMPPSPPVAPPPSPPVEDNSTAVFVSIIAVLGVVVAAGTLFGAWRLGRFVRTAFEAKAQQEAAKRKRVQKAVAAATSTQATCCLISFRQFAKLKKLLPHELVRDRGLLTCLDTYDDLAAFALRHGLVFFSHQWVAWAHPDPKGTQYDNMVRSCNCLCSANLYTPDDLFIFVDYISISQRNERARLAAIDSLGVFSSLCKHFVVVAPPTVHADTGLECSLSTYSRRGWCRLEQWAHLCMSGIQEMYYYDPAAGRLVALDSPELEVSNWIVDSLMVYEGDYTQESNKEEMVDVVLGLYAMVLKDRGGKTKELFDMIGAHLHRVFPPAYFSNMPELLKSAFEHDASLASYVRRKSMGEGGKRDASAEAFAALRTQSDRDLARSLDALTPRSRKGVAATRVQAAQRGKLSRSTTAEPSSASKAREDPPLAAALDVSLVLEAEAAPAVAAAAANSTAAAATGRKSAHGAELKKSTSWWGGWFEQEQAAGGGGGSIVA